MTLFTLILSFVIPIACVLLSLSLYALYRTIQESVTPTYELRDLSKADRHFIFMLFDRMGLLSDVAKECDVTESGVYTSLSKDELTKRVGSFRQLKFQTTAVVVGILTAVVFESIPITFSLVAVIFASSMLDRFLMKVMVNNLMLLLEEG